MVYKCSSVHLALFSCCARVHLEERSHSVSAECGVLKPISFKLTVVRNLSAAWFKDSPELDVSAELQAIEVGSFDR